MISPGSKLLPSAAKSQQRRCICHDKDCSALTICFASMKDIRGSFMALPVRGDRLTDLKEFKIKRTLIHLGQYSTDKDTWTCSVDKRGQNTTTAPIAVTPDDDSARFLRSRNQPSTATTEVKVRFRTHGTLEKRMTGAAVVADDVLSKISAKKTPVRETKYIANHHFDPAILQVMLDQGKSTIDCMPAKMIKELNLVGNGYTDADLFHGDLPKSLLPEASSSGPVYVPVPSYKSAKSDYTQVSTRWRLNEMIKSCRSKRRGNCTLAPRGQDDILQPVEKRGRLDAMPTMDADNKEDLQRAVCMLSDELDAAYVEINRLNDEIQLRDSLWKEGDGKFEKFSKETMGGLSRLNITSDVYHSNNPNVAKTLFGFEDRAKGSNLKSWDITKQFMKDMWDVDHSEPTLSSIFDAAGRRKKMNRFEQCLITLMWFQNLHEHQYIASIFGCDRNVVATIIKWWAPQFHEVGCHMARLPLEKRFLEKAYPQSYLDLNFSSYVATVCDGTDVLSQTVRKDRAVNVVSRSDKVKHSAFRGITWSLPMGLVHEFTDPFFARASEKAIVRLWAGHGRFRDLPVGWLISGDKGFDQTSVFYPYYNQILHPAFLTGGDKAQFSEQQMDWNRKACEKRYTSEVVFSRFKKYGGLGQIMDRSKFHFVHYLWAWAHGMANDYLPLQIPANCDWFPKSKYSK